MRKQSVLFVLLSLAPLLLCSPAVVSAQQRWERYYGGWNSAEGYSVQQTSDSGYIVAGYTTSFGNGYQVYLIKTNASGDTLWTRTYGGTNSDLVRSVQQTQDGGYILTGQTNSFGAGNDDVYLIKTNATGDTLWTKTYGGADYDRGNSVQQTSDGGYIVAGNTSSTTVGGHVYLIKTDANGSSGVEESRQADKGTRGQGVTARPNPFTSFASVPGHEGERFSLYDVSGRRVGIYRGDRIGAGLSPGVYFLKPESQAGKPIRIVKVR